MDDTPAGSDESRLLAALGPIIQALQAELPALLTTGLETPATSIGKLEVKLRSLADVDDALGRELLSALLSDAAINAFTVARRQDEEELQRTPAGRALLELYRRACAVRPLLAIHEMALWDWNRAYTEMARPLRFLKQARGDRGEKRAEAVRLIWADSTEALYLPYLRLIWRLTNHCEGALRPMARDLGGQLRAMKAMNDLDRTLIDFDVGHTRNAAVHHQWTYLPDIDQVELRDRNWGPDRQSVDRLLERLEAVLLAGGRLAPTVARLCSLSALVLLIPTMKPEAGNLTSADPEVRRAAWVALEAKFNATYGEEAKKFPDKIDPH